MSKIFQFPLLNHNSQNLKNIHKWNICKKHGLTERSHYTFSGSVILNVMFLEAG